MDDPVPGAVDACDPVSAYVGTIRSVLFIDDHFPKFADADHSTFKEAARARALWQACVDRGWLCDIDNSADWAADHRRNRLAASDLLVIDLHLIGEDASSALKIVSSLAASDTANLVVVYTADPDLDRALLLLAAAARGASAEALVAEHADGYDDLRVEWTTDDVLSFLVGKGSWMATFVAECQGAKLKTERSVGASLMERFLHHGFGAPGIAAPRIVEQLKCGTNRWFQCGNLFLSVVGKPVEQHPDREADVLFGGLEAAVGDWAPPWLACLIAGTRRAVEAGAFRDDVLLPHASLQGGLLRYVRTADDPESRTRRSRELAAHLLARRFEVASRTLATQLEQRATTEALGADDPVVRDEMLRLNAFLCSEVISRHHLRVGSIFRDSAGTTYWVCVTPACDMVPREPRPSIDPWAAELDPLRPMTALRLKLQLGAERVTALDTASRGRYVFFHDTTKAGGLDTVLVAACFNLLTGDPNPRLEQMFAADRGRITNGKVALQRCKLSETGESIVIETFECSAVCQLRAPYAERLAHVVGHHLSRIGVNFLQPTTTED